MINFASASEVIAVLGFLAFLVNIIVEMVKDMSLIKDVPTKLVVLIISLIINLSVFIAYTSYTGNVVQIYEVISIVIGSFVVSYISMYGYDSLKELYVKSQSKKQG